MAGVAVRQQAASQTQEFCCAATKRRNDEPLPMEQIVWWMELLLLPAQRLQADCDFPI